FGSHQPPQCAPRVGAVPRRGGPATSGSGVGRPPDHGRDHGPNRSFFFWSELGEVFVGQPLVPGGTHHSRLLLGLRPVAFSAFVALDRPTPAALFQRAEAGGRPRPPEHFGEHAIERRDLIHVGHTYRPKSVIGVFSRCQADDVDCTRQIVGDGGPYGDALIPQTTPEPNQRPRHVIPLLRTGTDVQRTRKRRKAPTPSASRGLATRTISDLPPASTVASMAADTTSSIGKVGVSHRGQVSPSRASQP